MYESADRLRKNCDYQVLRRRCGLFWFDRVVSSCRKPLAHVQNSGIRISQKYPFVLATSGQSLWKSQRKMGLDYGDVQMRCLYPTVTNIFVISYLK